MITENSPSEDSLTLSAKFKDTFTSGSLELIRYLSFDLLANDFLTLLQPDSSGATLEAQVYLVKKVFPALVVALEHLLLRVMCPPSFPYSTNTTYRQLDHAPLTFHPIRWLAQYLFRHAEVGPTKYTLQLNQVADNLHQRLIALQNLRIAQLKAEKEARRLEYENQCKLKALLLEKKKNLVREQVDGILRKLPKILKLHHPIQFTDVLTTCQKIINSSFFEEFHEKKNLVQHLYDSLVEKCNTPLLLPSMDVDSTNFSTSLSTHPSEHITNVLVEWNDLEIATCVSSLISWITAEEETLIQFEVDTFLKQWESTGLSLQHAFKLALMYNEAWLTDELVEELQDMVQKNNMETSAHLDLLNKMARTNLKCISGLYEKHHAHPELKETAVQSTNMAVASSSEVCASNEVMSILKPVPESNSIRKKEVQDLVTTFSYEWREKALLGYHLNAILTKTSQALSENSELSDQVLQSKLSIPLHDYQTYTVPNVDYLVDYFTRKWGKLTDQEWNQLATTFLNISSQQKQQALSSPTFNTLPEPIDKLSPDYSTACITALAPLLEKLPSNARIHIAFQTHPSEGEETSSSDPKYTVMSSTHPEAVGTSLHGPLFQEWMQQPTPSAPHLVMESTPGHVQAWTPEAMMAPVPLGYAMAIPLRMLSGTVGFIYVDALQQVSFTKAFTTTEDMKVFLDTHAKVLQEASDQLRRTLDTMDQLHQIRVIVESSVSFLREQAQADPTFYLVQAPYLYSVGLQSSHVLETTDWASLCHTLKTQPPLTVVERTEATEFMYQCVSTKMNQSNGPQTALPILDSSGQVSVVMVLASFSSTETLQSDDLKEVQKIAQVLGSALSTATKRKPVRKLGLAAEALDSQGELIFVTFMLDSIRESIRELDSSAIAELKSYKKPPPTIHKVLKCLCYLFGKTPKQVKLWSDTIKYINMDMLKQMLNYDPTAIQKKSIFIRIRKVLKTIPHGDVRKKGSLPALTVYAWLLVSLDLRDKSIQARRRAMEKEGKKSSEPPEEDLEVDEPLEDELTDEDA